MTGDHQAPVASEIEALRSSIEHEASQTELLLGHGRSRPAENHPASAPFDRAELRRQLAALRERATAAFSETQDPMATRAELATLLCFAKTLLSDTEAWRGALQEVQIQRERQLVVARRERQQLMAQQAELARQRDTLQIKIDGEAARIARTKHGECRHTLPVITLGDGLTVSSITVSRPRRIFRSLKLWLVTIDRAGHGIVVTRG